MDDLVLGIDAGNYKAKTAGRYGTDTFRTNICDWFVRDVEEHFGSDDMEFLVDGRRGYAGTIAMYEDEFGDGTVYGDTKAHGDTLIRVLLAISRYLDKFGLNTKRLSIVVGQPIKKHTEAEKAKMKNMLMRHHTFTVNNKEYEFTIANVGVAPEGSAAFWAKPIDGKLHIIDAGSGTVNASTIINKRHINTASDTFHFGAETISKKEDYEGIARGITRGMTRLKWDKNDKVLVCGGIARRIFPYIVKEYPNAELLVPHFSNGKELILLEPVYANALGLYNLAKGQFG